ncbi:MAG: internalization-related competence protein ComEC/Rec2 [Herminiimonas sp.]|nr:internalization-related competence protein ComEC/Rec2 [Herminiimonas sp.]
MRSLILGLAVGACWLQQQADLPNANRLWPLLFLLLSVGLLACRPSSARARIPLLLAAGTLAGFAWAAILAENYLARELPSDLEGRDLIVAGTVASLPYRFDGGTRFDFLIEPDAPVQLAEADRVVMRRLPPRIALSWYADRQDAESITPPVEPGERWQLAVRLRRPRGSANPWGFDYEVWLLEQGLRATGTVRPDDSATQVNRRLERFVPSFSGVVERSRSWLRDRIVAALDGKPYAGVIVALVVGDQRGISQSDWKVFNRTGIGHLISISGLHITMVAGLCAALIFFLWRHSFFTGAALPLRLPAHKAAAVGAVVTAFVYVLLAGFGVPAQRTLYMVFAVAAALWCGRITAVSHVLCLALGVVILLDPWAVLWPGFWLSFGAVGVILFASVGRSAAHGAELTSRWQRARRTLIGAARTQYVVTVGLVPLTLLLFGQTSLVSPFANAIAIPLISLLVTPLSLVGVLLPMPLAGWLLGVAHALVALLADALIWLSALPAAVWSAPVPPWWIGGLALVGTGWMLAPRGWPARWLGAVAWLPLVLVEPAHPEAGIWLSIFDVGQGTAVLVETANHRLLYDTGPFYAPGADAGERLLVPYLKARGITSLEKVVVSHHDNDHSGGALSIMKALPVGEVLSSLNPEDAIPRAAAAHRRCQAGQRWTWDAVQFEMVHPPATSYGSDKWKPNALSCTLKVTFNGQAILLPGDIEAVQEDELVNGMGAQLQSLVLLAPHHGSSTSSTGDFLDAVKPALAVFQVGYQNRFGHPKPEIVARYDERGIAGLRSDASGAVLLRLDDKGLNVEEFRKTHARYWYGR